MSEPLTPSAPPPPPQAPPPSAPAKKGLPPIAWVAIGCGALLLVGLVLAMAGGWFVAKQVKNVAQDFEDNPTMAAAEMFVRLNPELELVESDREKSTLKVRNKETGEVLVFDAEELAEGRVRFGKEGEEATLTFSGEEGEGVLTVEGPEGETTFRAGAGGAVEVPEWVPLVAGGTPQGVFSTSSPEGATGAFTVVTDDSVAEVLEFYRSELEDAGFEVETTTHSTDGVDAASVQARSEDGRRQLTVGITVEEGSTQVMLHYTEAN